MIERKVQQVINLNVNNNYGVSNISINSTSKTTSKKWELTDELKQQITEYALEDAKNGYYMDKKFSKLRTDQVATVAPDRRSLMAAANQMIDADIIEQTKEKYQKYFEALLGKKYDGESIEADAGSCVHIKDKNGDEILTYTPSSGWHEKPSKEETRVHMAMRGYYEKVYDEERKRLGVYGQVSYAPSGGWHDISI